MFKCYHLHIQTLSSTHMSWNNHGNLMKSGCLWDDSQPWTIIFAALNCPAGRMLGSHYSTCQPGDFRRHARGSYGPAFSFFKTTKRRRSNGVAEHGVYHGIPTIDGVFQGVFHGFPPKFSQRPWESLEFGGSKPDRGVTIPEYWVYI